MDHTCALNVRLQVSLCRKYKQRGKIYMLHEKHGGKRKTNVWLTTTIMNYNPFSYLVIRMQKFLIFNVSTI